MLNPALRNRALPALLLVLTVFAVACTQRKVVVRMRDDGGVPQRTFSDNAPSSTELTDLAQAYGHAPERDPESGDVSFQASFTEELPSELDGANGWNRLRSGLGDTTFWYEAPDVSRNAWPRLVRRVESGILWLRILKRWAQARYDEDRAELVDRVFEEEFIPGIVDGYLRWVGAGSILGAQRVGLRVRGDDDRSELSDDEFFRLQVILPLLIALATDGPLEPDELHAAFLLGLDGGASRSERDRVWKSVGQPAVLRFLQRFEPERTDVTLEEIRSWGFSILLFAGNISGYRDLMLESPAVSEEDKATLRGGGLVLPPAPFGVKFIGRATPTLATLELEPAHPAFMTNGISVPPDERGRPPSGDGSELLRFELQIRPEEEGPLFGSPPAYALWSTPDAARQEAIFGEVVLEGRALAAVASWESLLPESDRAAWLEALEEAVRAGSPDPLATWLGDRTETAPEALTELVGLAPTGVESD